ncbi:MAG: cobalamin-dependent protein, partial [Candidatus Paceibacterota bacterium]
MPEKTMLVGGCMNGALLIAYDNGSHIPFFPLNLAYICAAMEKNGWNVEISHQDIVHFPDERLTVKIEAGRYDLVGMGFVGGYWQYKRALSISAAVNKCRNRSTFKYVLGGHGPAAEPEYFLQKLGADHVIVGEAEEAILNLDKPIVWAPRIKNIDNLPWPAYEKFPTEIYRLHRFPNSAPTDFTMPMLSGRHCPFSCSFCYRMTPGFSPRKPSAVMEELTWLHDRYRISHFQFADELLMSSKYRAVQFAEAILNLPFKIKWDCNGRLNYADPEVLAVMKRSGCNYINYGVEALDDEVLRLM